MGPLGYQEMVVIFLLALIIFGPKKLPELGKTVGKAMTEFRRASNELKSTWNREMAEIEREGRSIRETTQKISSEITSNYDQDRDFSGYPYNYEPENEDGFDASTSSDSPATDSSTVGASATQGAESTAADSPAGQAPEGTVPASTETASAPSADGDQQPETKAVTT